MPANLTINQGLLNQAFQISGLKAKKDTVSQWRMPGRKLLFQNPASITPEWFIKTEVA